MIELDMSDILELNDLLNKGLKDVEIADQFGVSVAELNEILNELREGK